MSHKLAGLALAIILAAALAGPSAAAAPAKQPPAAPAATTGGVTITPSTTAASAAKTVTNVEEGQKVAEIQAILATGEFDKAIEAANTFLKTARDETSKTEVFRIVAEAYRKKGDWRQAPQAYQRLRERFEKGSEDWTKYDAIAEILRASPAGVYQPAGAAAPKAPGAAPAAGQTLSDDGALAEALTRLAGFRSSRFKARIPNITRAATPQLVVAAFAPVAEEARQLFVLSADAPPEGPREVCLATGNRLQTLSAPILATLRAKLEKYQPKFNNPWNLSNVDKADVKSSQALCRELADNEGKFQQSLLLATGIGDWPDQARLQKESTDRRAGYEQLAKEYVAPTYFGIRSAW